MIPFSAVVRSEWTKLASLRGNVVMVTVAILLGVGLMALFALVAGLTWHDWGAEELADWEPISVSQLGGIVSAIFFLVIGVKAATSEYATGMIRVTFAATPRRGRVLAAKAVVVAAVSLVAGLVLSLAMFVAAQAIFAAYGLESAGLGDRDALRLIAGSGLLSPVFPVIALALGFILRSTAGAVIAVLGVILAPAFLSGVLPSWWSDHVLPLMPGPATDAISLGHLEGTEAGLHPAVAALVVVGWVALFLGGAWAVLERRDA